MPEFTFELCASCVLVLDRAVRRAASDHGRENAAMEAGKRIRGGSRELADLHDIARWKAPRAAHHILSPRNSIALVKRVLDVATADEPTANKVDALDELVGVNVAMASAILTCIDPNFYTVIDVRALDALNATHRTIRRELYLRYLAFCQLKARALGVELRQLDRALWKSGSIA